MNNLEKYLDQVIDQKPAAYEPLVDERPPEESPPPNILGAVRKRWYLIPFCAILFGGLGVPAVWFLVKPTRVIQGAVRVAPAEPRILSSETGRGDGSGYRDFINTEAMRLTAGAVLQDIADDLERRELAYFSGEPQSLIEKLRAKLEPPRGRPDVAVVLQKAIANGTIRAGLVPQTTLLAVTMECRDAGEGKQIVQSFLTNYEASYRKTSSEDDTRNLNQLKKKQAELAYSLGEQRKDISAMALEYGSIDLDPQHDMELRRQTVLLTELTRLQAAKIRLTADVNMIEAIGPVEPNFTPMQYVEARDAAIASDPLINALSESIAAMTREQIVAEQTLTERNPMRIRTTERLRDLTSRLDERRAELERQFNVMLRANVENQRAQVGAQLQAVQGLLEAQEFKTKEVGRANLTIQDKQFQMAIDQELYDTVSRRIKMIEMEQQGLPRITPGYPPQVIRTNDKRTKFSAGLLLAGVGCGFGLALLLEKLNKTLQTPDDVVRHIDLPVIGTTTSSRSVKPKLFAEQIAGDYQTIRTNLGLLSSTGMPKKLAVSSAGMREGKTTFAVNLATSLAKSGKRVLLIDGDLRRPDIGYMLNIPNGSGGVQEVLLGEDPRGIICAVPSSGLHVLAANPRSTADVYEILTSPTAAEQIARLAQDYDHVIIDTPPTLAFPDALVWAKLADAVVLISYAGQTTAPELKETKERFARVRARVLGAVLSNVPVDQGLYRYGHSYRTHSAHTPRKARTPKKLLLPTHAKSGEGGGNQT